MESWKIDLLNKRNRSTRKYRCSWGQCNSDSRYYTKREDMKNIFLLAFPAKVRKREKCLQWIKACNRPHSQLNTDKLKDCDYICSKHFLGGNGPTENDPNPLIADKYCKKLSTGRKRPKSRDDSDVPASKKKLFESEQEAIEALLKLQTPSETPDSDNLASPQIPNSDLIDENNASNIETISQNIDITSKKINCPSCKVTFELSSVEQKRVLRANFIQTKLSNNSSCFHYTGVPTSHALLDIFKWIEPCAKEIKLWDGKNKLVPERNIRGRSGKLPLFSKNSC